MPVLVGLGRVAAPIALTCAVIAAVRLPRPARAYADGPPAAHTGGFGEPTCHRCHFDHSLNESSLRARLTLADAPASFTAGRRYRLRVAVSQPEMRAAGFQLTARFADGPQAGRQAGSFRAADARADVRTTRGSSIQYAQHTRVGTVLTATDSAAWTIEWTAPRTSAGRVVFHVSANAANGDDSEFGDHIYAASFVAESATMKK